MSINDGVSNKTILMSIQAYERLAAVSKAAGHAAAYASALDTLQELCHEAFTRKIAEPVWIARVK